MESVRVYPRSIFESTNPDYHVQAAVTDLQQTFENLVRFLFGDIQMRWVPGSFPFTDPSLELEIFFNGEWMEMLGSGLIHKNVLKNGGRGEDEIGWAAGIGIERFAMLLYDITDIRLFWSEDDRYKNNLNFFLFLSKMNKQIKIIL
jgi:phenylalanyl-tRNA synthetase alpha chain